MRAEKLGYTAQKSSVEIRSGKFVEIRISGFLPQATEKKEDVVVVQEKPDISLERLRYDRYELNELKVNEVKTLDLATRDLGLSEDTGDWSFGDLLWDPQGDYFYLRYWDRGTTIFGKTQEKLFLISANLQEIKEINSRPGWAIGRCGSQESEIRDKLKGNFKAIVSYNKYHRIDRIELS